MRMPESFTDALRRVSLVAGSAESTTSPCKATRSHRSRRERKVDGTTEFVFFSATLKYNLSRREIVCLLSRQRHFTPPRLREANPHFSIEGMTSSIC
jgi:hypothetical protein